MENSKNKTDNFLKAIKKYADEQRSAMQTEVAQLKEEKLKEVQRKLLSFLQTMTVLFMSTKEI